MFVEFDYVSNFNICHFLVFQMNKVAFYEFYWFSTKKKRNNKKICLPTDPDFFRHVSGNTDKVFMPDKKLKKGKIVSFYVNTSYFMRKTFSMVFKYPTYCSTYATYPTQLTTYPTHPTYCSTYQLTQLSLQLIELIQLTVQLIELFELTVQLMQLIQLSL